MFLLVIQAGTAAKIPTSQMAPVNFKSSTTPPVTSVPPGLGQPSPQEKLPLSSHRQRQGASQYSNPQPGSQNPAAAAMWPPPPTLPPSPRGPADQRPKYTQPLVPGNAPFASSEKGTTQYSRVVIGRSYIPGATVEQAFSQKGQPIQDYSQPTQNKSEGKKK